MKPLPKRKSVLEKEGVQEPLRRLLEANGWLTYKTHGNAYMKGWPDLLCIHRTWGQKWVECKRPKGGRFTKDQETLFQDWDDNGVQIYLVKDPDISYEQFLELVRGQANWQLAGDSPECRHGKRWRDYCDYC